MSIQGSGDDGSLEPKEAARTAVYVMLPLDTVNEDGVFQYAESEWFSKALHIFFNSGVIGVAVDLWWGVVEAELRDYNWTGYKQLFELVKCIGLKLQVVLAFHACGGNVGDGVHIPLPAWVLRAGDLDPDIFFADKMRSSPNTQRNREYISIFADNVPCLLMGRSPMQCYEDFMVSFRDTFHDDLGFLVTEVVIGAGPCGELRYPSYAETSGWQFPGVGEFQCYDGYALGSLAQAARECGYPEWGYGGPHDSGTYNDVSEATPFFAANGSWQTPYGKFFLTWYSESLLHHGERLLSVGKKVFAGKLRQRVQQNGEAQSRKQAAPGEGKSGGPDAPKWISGFPGRQCVLQDDSLELNLKIAGIHWAYRTCSHGAELTAGYFNTETRNGYRSVVELCAQYGASLTLTCVEMSDAQHPTHAKCSPEGLLWQIREAAAAAGVELSGENALPIFFPNGCGVDAAAFDRVAKNTREFKIPASQTGDSMNRGQPWSMSRNQRLPALHRFTFLRLGSEIFDPSYHGPWVQFMRSMQS